MNKAGPREVGLEISLFWGFFPCWLNRSASAGPCSKRPWLIAPRGSPGAARGMWWGSVVDGFGCPTRPRRVNRPASAGPCSRGTWLIAFRGSPGTLFKVLGAGVRAGPGPNPSGLGKAAASVAPRGLTVAAALAPGFGWARRGAGRLMASAVLPGPAGLQGVGLPSPAG